MMEAAIEKGSFAKAEYLRSNEAQRGDLRKGDTPQEKDIHGLCSRVTAQRLTSPVLYGIVDQGRYAGRLVEHR
jgi:hypothetical protein